VSAGGKPEPYEVVVPEPVRRAISEKFPEGVAWAVIEFINGPLARNPHRVGIELRGHLKGIYSAHLGSFRVQYEINDEGRTVTVRRVEHRSDIYGLP
jgi:mRNA interferase RelE/StbE